MKKKNSEKKAPTKPAKPAEKKPSEVLAEQVYAVMQKLAENGITEVSSRLISDKLGLEPDKGRGQVRNAMKKLEADGKVIIERKALKGKREQYVYKLKASEITSRNL